MAYDAEIPRDWDEGKSFISLTALLERQRALDIFPGEIIRFEVLNGMGKTVQIAQYSPSAICVTDLTSAALMINIETGIWEA